MNSLLLMLQLGDRKNEENIDLILEFYECLTFQMSKNSFFIYHQGSDATRMGNQLPAYLKPVKRMMMRFNTGKESESGWKLNV